MGEAFLGMFPRSGKTVAAALERNGKSSSRLGVQRAEAPRSRSRRRRSTPAQQGGAYARRSRPACSRLRGGFSWGAWWRKRMFPISRWFSDEKLGHFF